VNKSPRWILHTAVDDMGSGLIDFIPMVYKAWKAFYAADVSICIVGNGDTADYKERYSKYCDIMHVVRPVEGFSRPANGKLARLWSACLLPDTLPVMLDDIDWVPLQDSYFAVKFREWKPGYVLRLGMDVYKDNWHEIGKAPMGTFTGMSQMLGEIINPGALPFVEYCQSEAHKPSIDCEGRDNPHHPSNYSDESTMRRALEAWNHPDLIIDTNRDFHTFNDTIDRARWDLFNVDKMRDNGYIGSHMLRPYATNVEGCACAAGCGWREGIPGLRPIIEYIDEHYDRYLRG